MPGDGRRRRGGQEPRGRGSPVRRRSRFDDELDDVAGPTDSSVERVPEGADRWSTWDRGERGPEPRPDWLVADAHAVDHELGSLHSGRSAEIDLVRRSVLDGGPSCLMVAKRYAEPATTGSHWESAFLEGRQTRSSREMRAMEQRSAFGRGMAAQVQAAGEFAHLARLSSARAPVPYPVQRVGPELLEEFFGSDSGDPAPRLATLRPDRDQLEELWDQLVEALTVFTQHGIAHGDLSAYSILVHGRRLVLVDLGHAVDLAVDPGGLAALRRDVATAATWFTARGLDPGLADVDDITGLLAVRAGFPAPGAVDDPAGPFDA